MAGTTNNAAPTLGGAAAYFTVLYFVLQGDIPEQYQTEAAVMAGVLFTHAFWELGAFRTWIVKLVERKVGEKEE